MQDTFPTENNCTPTINHSEQIQKETIKRQVEILTESIQLVNTQTI